MRQFRLLFVFLSFISSSAYSEITLLTFNKTIDEFSELYTVRLKNDLQLNLESINRYWISKSTITKSSARIIPQEKKVLLQIDGEFSRNVYANEEAFVLIICHELGHIYKDRMGLSRLRKEGQADYFAAQCALDFYNYKSKEALADFCQNSSLEDGTVVSNCKRVISGIRAFAKVLNVDFDTLYDSDEKDYVANLGLHPTASCRVKTLIAGLFRKEMPACATGVKPVSNILPMHVDGKF